MKIWIVLLDLIHLEDGILHMDINRSSKEEDNHRPPDDIGGNEDLVHALDKLMVNPSLVRGDGHSCEPQGRDH